MHDVKVEAVDMCLRTGREFHSSANPDRHPSTMNKSGSRWFPQGHNGDIDVSMAQGPVSHTEPSARHYGNCCFCPPSCLQYTSTGALFTDLPPLRVGWGWGGEVRVARLSFAATFPRLGSKKCVLIG